MNDNAWYVEHECRKVEDYEPNSDPGYRIKITSDKGETRWIGISQSAYLDIKNVLLEDAI